MKGDEKETLYIRYGLKFEVKGDLNRYCLIVVTRLCSHQICRRISRFSFEWANDDGRSDGENLLKPTHPSFCFCHYSISNSPLYFGTTNTTTTKHNAFSYTRLTFLAFLGYTNKQTNRNLRYQQLARGSVETHTVCYAW